MKQLAFFAAFLMLFALACPVLADPEAGQTCPACGEPVGEAAYCPSCGAANPHGSPSAQGEAREPGKIVCEAAQTAADRYGVKLDSQSGLPKYRPKDGQPLNAVLLAPSKCEQARGGERSTVEKAGVTRELESLMVKCAKAIEKESGGCIRFVEDLDRADLLFSFQQRYEYFGKYTGENGETASAYSCCLWLSMRQPGNTNYEALVTFRTDPPGIVTVSAGKSAFYMTSPVVEDSEQVRQLVDTALLWYGYNPSGSRYQGMNASGLRKALERLHALGYLEDPSGNSYDESVQEAVRNLQRDRCLVPTGGLDRITLTALYFDEDAIGSMRKPYLAGMLADGKAAGSFCEECGRFWGGTDARYCSCCGSPLTEAEEAGEREGVVPGSIVTFGHYEQDNSSKTKDGIEWIVLDVQDGKALLLSRWVLDTQQYNRKDQPVTWEKCSLRSWLNREFIKAAFSKEEQKSIVSTVVPNGPEQNSPRYSTDGGNDTEDRVFLLSYAEAWKYLDTGHARIAAATPYAAKRGATSAGAYLVDGLGATPWYLRTPIDTLDRVGFVGISGTHSGNGVTVKDIGVRPALWVDAASIVS